MVLGNFTISSCKGDQTLKKPTGRKLKTINVEDNINDDRKESIHKIRKKIEDILLEREQKKLWDL